MTEGEQLDPKTQFRQLYDQEYLSVYRSIRAVVLESAAAEDLTQETFVRAYRARLRYTPTAPPGAWLRRIGISLAISYLRRQKLARFLLDWAGQGQDSKHGIRARLTLTQEEIGQIIGTSRETVSRMFSEFRTSQLATMKGSTLIIQDRAALEKLTAT